MTYVYRDPTRLHGRPVHVPEDVPAAAPVAQAIEPEPPRPAPILPIPPKKTPRPLPTPLWGGRLGLELASAEVLDWEQRHPRHQPPERRDS